MLCIYYWQINAALRWTKLKFNASFSLLMFNLTGTGKTLFKDKMLYNYIFGIVLLHMFSCNEDSKYVKPLYALV